MSGSVGAVSLGEGAVPREPVSEVISTFNKMPMDPKVKMGLMNEIANGYETSGMTRSAEQLRAAAKKDVFHYDGEGKTQVELGKGAREGQQISTSPPSQEVLTNAGKQGYARLDNVARVRFGGRDRTGAEVQDILTRGMEKHPELTKKIMKNNGIVQNADGSFGVKLESESAGYSALAPGAGDNVLGGNILGFLNSGWALPAMGVGGLVAGGVGGLITSLAMGSALKSSASAMGGSMGFLGSGSGVLANVGNISGAAGYGTGAAMAEIMGFHGMAFNMRKIMRSYVADFQDQSMMAMINNPAIPIEDLIFMFMAYMGDKYEKKLREKMEETMLAEKKERERERKMSEARLLGGIVGGGISLATGGLGSGVGSMIGGAIESVAQRQIAIKEQLDGNMKSSTILMQEVQMLMHKWKQINEMLSNLMKAMHDMAMTPIRNIR